jgi:hypothetical protein
MSSRISLPEAAEPGARPEVRLMELRGEPREPPSKPLEEPPRPMVFRGKNQKADEDEKDALKNGQKQAQNAQKDKRPADDSNCYPFDRQSF